MAEFLGAVTGVWLLAALLRYLVRARTALAVVYCGCVAGAVYCIAASAISGAPPTWIYVLATLVHVPFAVSMFNAKQPVKPVATETDDEQS
jgi:4-hydroxy-3-methylbut-2-enyl diphosphate reductase IspH